MTTVIDKTAPVGDGRGLNPTLEAIDATVTTRERLGAPSEGCIPRGVLP